MKTYITSQLNKIGINPTEKQLTQLITYMNELTLWNKKINLVRAKGTELVDRHIIDSLAGLEEMKKLKSSTNERTEVADVGSGAGLPGIPLAIFLEDYNFSLIERAGKRASFLNYTVGILGLSKRVTVINKPLEEVSEKFDIVTFRAFRQFDDFVIKLLNITNETGVLAAYKGKKVNILEEIEASKISGEVKIVQLPKVIKDIERNLVIIR